MLSTALLGSLCGVVYPASFSRDTISLVAFNVGLPSLDHDSPMSV